MKDKVLIIIKNFKLAFSFQNLITGLYTKHRNKASLLLFSLIET